MSYKSYRDRNLGTVYGGFYYVGLSMFEARLCYDSYYLSFKIYFFLSLILVVHLRGSPFLLEVLVLNASLPSLETYKFSYNSNILALRIRFSIFFWSLVLFYKFWVLNSKMEGRLPPCISTLLMVFDLCFTRSLSDLRILYVFCKMLLPTGLQKVMPSFDFLMIASSRHYITDSTSSWRTMMEFMAIIMS